MSDIKFLVDDFKEEDRKELNEIEKQIKIKPLTNYKETVFLKKFILSMMKQYYIPKHKEIMELQNKINFSMPDLKMVVPHIMPKSPNKIEISTFMLEPPKQLNLFKEIPEHKEEVRLDLSPKPLIQEVPKKIIPVPRPIEVPRPF